MAGVATGVTVTLPSGSVSEVADIRASRGGMSIGYSSVYNPQAGTLTLTSYDDPQATIGVRGPINISGNNLNLTFARGYVEKVDTSASTRGVVTYTTTIKLIDIGS